MSTLPQAPKTQDGAAASSRRQFMGRSVAMAAALSAPPLIGRAATPVAFGYSAVSDFATVFVATEQGFFSRNGLALEPRFMPLNPTIIPGIQSGSLQLGGPTPTSFLQAVDAGLDHVVVGGGGVLSKRYTDLALVARSGERIRSAADCVGRRIGVPGLGALLHVTFRHWLKLNQVDPAKVSFVEAPFPQHGDLLRSAAVDAVVTGGPFMNRIIEAGSGQVAAYYTTFLPENYPTILHVARRDWAAQNPALVKGFRDGIAEAARFMAQPANNSAVRDALAKYLKVPAPVAAAMQISPPGPLVSLPQLQWWATLMKNQNMLKNDPALDGLLVKA